MSTGRDSDKFMLRMPDGLRDRIKAAADTSGRSMNAEIVAVLLERFPDPDEQVSVSTADLRALLAAAGRISDATLKPSPASKLSAEAPKIRDARAELEGAVEAIRRRTGL